MDHVYTAPEDVSMGHKNMKPSYSFEGRIAFYSISKLPIPSCQE
jgi:hypothetical protein